MTLHREECPNLSHYMEKEIDRCTPVEYVGRAGQVFQVFLVIDSLDRQGLLADVGNTFAEMKTNITAVRTQSHRDGTATIELAIEVSDTIHLAYILGRVQSMRDIIKTRRSMGGREEAKLQKKVGGK